MFRACVPARRALVLWTPAPPCSGRRTRWTPRSRKRSRARHSCAACVCARACAHAAPNHHNGMRQRCVHCHKRAGTHATCPHARTRKHTRTRSTHAQHARCEGGDSVKGRASDRRSGAAAHEEDARKARGLQPTAHVRHVIRLAVARERAAAGAAADAAQVEGDGDDAVARRELARNAAHQVLAAAHHAVLVHHQCAGAVAGGGDGAREVRRGARDAEGARVEDARCERAAVGGWHGRLNRLHGGRVAPCVRARAAASAPLREGGEERERARGRGERWAQKNADVRHTPAARAPSGAAWQQPWWASSASTTPAARCACPRAARAAACVARMFVTSPFSALFSSDARRCCAVFPAPARKSGCATSSAPSAPSRTCTCRVTGARRPLRRCSHNGAATKNPRRRLVARARRRLTHTARTAAPRASCAASASPPSRRRRRSKRRCAPQNHASATHARRHNYRCARKQSHSSVADAHARAPTHTARMRPRSWRPAATRWTACP
jgi:hypothetical protein